MSQTLKKSLLVVGFVLFCFVFLLVFSLPFTRGHIEDFTELNKANIWKAGMSEIVEYWFASEEVLQNMYHKRNLEQPEA